METISVPVNLVSLSAAIEARLAVLTPEFSPDDILTIIRLVETIEATLDRLAQAIDAEAVDA